MQYADWLLVHSADRRALAVVDGLGRFAAYGPHYSRRTPGSPTFTGVGQEVVLLHESEAAVWAVVYQKTPAARGSGRGGPKDPRPQYVWRNMLFRRLPECPVLASDLVITATDATYYFWLAKYGTLPTIPLRTEIGIKNVKSTNPGYCYRLAGWTPGPVKRGLLHLYAPPPEEA